MIKHIIGNKEREERIRQEENRLTPIVARKGVFSF